MFYTEMSIGVHARCQYVSHARCQLEYRWDVNLYYTRDVILGSRNGALSTC